MVRSHFHGRNAAAARLPAIAMLALLAGCLDETSHQPPQQPPARSDVSGTVTDGTESRLQFVAGKGTSGIPRQARAASSGAYALSLVNLAGPYLLANTLTPGADPDKVVLTSVATGPGTVNITPFTTLLTAQVLGVSPANAISSYNSGSTPSALITDTAIRAAQQDLAGFLKDVYDIDVGAASLIDTPFTAAAGDPMFDAITALNDKLSDRGRKLSSLAADVAIGAQACQSGSLQVLFTGAERRFCAARKRATPDDDDPTLVDYLFRNIAGEELTLRAQDTTVLAARLARVDGTAYSCATTACTGITLEPPEADESRFISFSSVSLAAAGASLVLNGWLLGAIPGVSLPPLACAANRFYMVFDDNSVIGDCITVSNPLNLSGNLGTDVGPGRTRWTLRHTGAEPLPSRPGVEVLLDMSSTVPSVVSVYYTDQDPAEGPRRYLCRFEQCNGITFGPAVTAVYFGIPVTTRDINLDRTLLSGLTEEGADTGLTGELSGTFTLLSTPNELAWPAAGPCDMGADAIEAEVSGPHAGTAQFNLCIGPNYPDFGLWYRYVYDNQDGTLQVFVQNELGDQQVLVAVDQGVVTRVDAWIGAAQFYCVGNDCAGVSVSAPDANGSRRLSLADTTLSLLERYPVPGDLQLRLEASDLLIPLYQ